MIRPTVAGALLFLAAQGVAGQTPLTARAELIDSAGAPIGEVTLTETPANGVLIQLRARGLAPGAHAFHIHETGRCDTPSFQSAGGHYDPHGRSHGLLHEEGMHGGDLLNLEVPESGAVEAERLAQDVTLEDGAEGTLFDEDDSAIVIHAGADDYRSQPAGDAGARVACGVVVK